MHLIRHAALLGLLVSAPLLAQTNTIELDGRVVGEDGHGLSGASVTVTGPGLIGNVTLTTDASGDYVLTDVLDGEHFVTVELDGYKTEHRSGIHVKPGVGGRANLVLALDRPEDAVVIRAVTNAATNLPPTITNSEIPRGGIINVWGQNIGPRRSCSTT